jgi:hypothetical protein
MIQARRVSGFAASYSNSGSSGGLDKYTYLLIPDSCERESQLGGERCVAVTSLLPVLVFWICNPLRVGT